MVTLPRFRSPGSHLTPRTQMDVEEGSLSFRAPGRGGKIPGKAPSLGGGVGRRTLSLSLLGKLSSGVERMRGPWIP